MATTEIFNTFRRNETEIGLQVSRQTPTLVLSLTLAMILAKSENLELMEFFAPSCVKKSALCGEWATTALYFAFQNYCYRSSGFVRPVDTIRNRSKITFDVRFTNCEA
jgi:hypothetical protein